jgi:hypothetical protein
MIDSILSRRATQPRMTMGKPAITQTMIGLSQSDHCIGVSDA